MTDRDMEQRLQNTLDRTAPDDLADVLTRYEAGKGTVIYMNNATNHPKRRRMGLIAACLALVLIGGAGGGVAYQQTHAVASVVSLDVNPSVQLTVNKNERVLSCTSLNAEAAAVLFDMGGGRDLEGAKLDVAVNAIVGALVRSGYLDRLDSAILISVEDNDTVRGERLQQELTASVGQTLQTASSGASVLSQTMTVDASLDAQAQQNNISSGKAYLAGQVQAMNDTLNFEALASLSVEELRDMKQTGAPDMPIGRDAALQAVLDSLGLTAGSYTAADVDPELDEPVPYYEVELLIDGQEREFGVHAYTGEVIPDRSVPDVTTPGPAVTPEGANGGAASDEPAVTPDGQESPAATPAVKPTAAPVTGGGQTGDIGKDAAKAAALAQAGVAEADASRLTVRKDRDDGRLEYDVEFRAGGYEYEYTVDGATGAILEQDVEPIRGGGTGSTGGTGGTSGNAPAATQAPAATKAPAATQAPSVTPAPQKPVATPEPQKPVTTPAPAPQAPAGGYRDDDDDWDDWDDDRDDDWDDDRDDDRDDDWDDDDDDDWDDYRPAQAQTQPQVQVQPQTQPQTQPQVQPQTQTQPQVQPQVQPQTQTQSGGWDDDWDDDDDRDDWDDWDDDDDD